MHYVYDGNVVIQERDQNNLPVVTYTRGVDLSGTLQGAGGIGGLLARTDMGRLTVNDPLASAYYHADGNGNITALITGLMDTNQVLVAKYLYDPYGNLLAESGPLAGANKYRFSSKEWDDHAGLYYYGFRFYDPNLQRWVNRDPLGEGWFDPVRLVLNRDLFGQRQGVNLYTYVGNGPTDAIDPDGRFLLPACCIAWGVFATLDIYDAIRDGTCAGYTGADFLGCLIQKGLSNQGLGDMTSCVGSAILTGIQEGSPTDAANRVADCFKCDTMHKLRDVGKFASEACCLGKLGQELLSGVRGGLPPLEHQPAF